MSTEHADIKEEPFTDEQVQLVIDLVKDIKKRHLVRADRIIGHGEIQPDNKTDPGILFPWEKLADAGLIPWPNSDQVNAVEVAIKVLPEVDWWQLELAKAGYDSPHTGIWDEHTRKLVQVFRDKYEPKTARLPISAHSVALLTVINSPNGLWIKQADGQRVVFNRK